MTEQEWLANQSPRELIVAACSDTISELRLRRLALAWCQTCWAQLSERSQRALVLAERCLDEGDDTEERVRAAEAAFKEHIAHAGRRARGTLDGKPDQIEAGSHAAHAVAAWEDRSIAFALGSALAFARFSLSDADCLVLLHDVLGNPFRPVAFEPAWRTDTVVQLARGMYESRDFSAMPILADALQDAGCENNDILSHCRDATQVHVRGCWVVDLVLGKA